MSGSTSAGSRCSTLPPASSSSTDDVACLDARATAARRSSSGMRRERETAGSVESAANDQHSRVVLRHALSFRSGPRAAASAPASARCCSECRNRSSRRTRRCRRASAPRCGSRRTARRRAARCSARRLARRRRWPVCPFAHMTHVRLVEAVRELVRGVRPVAGRGEADVARDVVRPAAEEHAGDQHPDRAVVVGTVGPEPLPHRLPPRAVVPVVEVVEQVVARPALFDAPGVCTPTPASATMFAVGVGSNGTAPRSVSRQVCVGGCAAAPVARGCSGARACVASGT